jgi:hypothetical protein
MPSRRTASRPGAGWTWRVFATCWLVYTAFWTPYILREHFPALALVERGSLNVERYVAWSDDIFRGPRGGAYINNNPGASLTAAVPLLLLKPVLKRVDDWNQKLPRIHPPAKTEHILRLMLTEGRAFYFLLAAFLTVAMVMAPATAGTAAYLCSRLADAGVRPIHAAQAALLYGLGTPVLFRAAHLNHNLLVCDAGFTAFLLLWDPRDAPLRALRASAAGLLAGYALLCDYSGVIVVAVIALYAWLRTSGERPAARFKILTAYAAGAAPGIAGLVIYQVWAFGSSYLPSQHYMTPTAPTAHGYRGIDWPSPALLWANFFDPRFGLFAYCPALLLAFAAPFVTRVRHRIPPRETTILFLYFLLFVAFCAANQYSWLQPLTGFRYLVPVVPALALLAMQTAQALPRWLRWMVAAAACAQSLLMVAGYQNTFPLAVRAVWQRHFELPWMIRLGYAGAPVTSIWPLAVFGLLALAVAAVWLLPRRQNAPADTNSLENNPLFFTEMGGRTWK